MASHIIAMSQNIANDLNVDVDCINVKASFSLWIRATLMRKPNDGIYLTIL